MAKFRKKPVVIEAMHFHGDKVTNADQIVLWIKSEGGNAKALNGRIHISTLEGIMLANEGDWVIRGIKGEFYPCKPDIFDATYEAVNG